jgi:hypothetical protein
MAVSREEPLVRREPSCADDEREECAVLAREPDEAGTAVRSARWIVRRRDTGERHTVAFAFL